MRRGLLIALTGVGVVIALVVGVGAGGDGDGDYKVRAIFNHTAYAIQGQDVMVAGAKVGSIEDLEVTDDLHAAVVLLLGGDVRLEIREGQHQVGLQVLDLVEPGVQER